MLRLYVVGGSTQSAWAIRNVLRLCAERLEGVSDLAIIDIYQHPRLAKDAQLVAAPTLAQASSPSPAALRGHHEQPGRRVLAEPSASTRVLPGREGAPAVSKPSTFAVHDLVLPVDEMQEMLSAIRSGEVDALVVADGGQQQVFVLRGADHAHRILLETLNEGAATIAPDGTILYANRRLSELLGCPPERRCSARS